MRRWRPSVAGGAINERLGSGRHETASTVADGGNSAQESAHCAPLPLSPMPPSILVVVGGSSIRCGRIILPMAPSLRIAAVVVVVIVLLRVVRS